MGGLFTWIGAFIIFAIIGSLGTWFVTKLTGDDEDGFIFMTILFAFCATELLFKNGLF